MRLMVPIQTPLVMLERASSHNYFFATYE